MFSAEDSAHTDSEISRTTLGGLVELGMKRQFAWSDNCLHMEKISKYIQDYGRGEDTDKPMVIG